MTYDGPLQQCLHSGDSALEMMCTQRRNNDKRIYNYMYCLIQDHIPYYLLGAPMAFFLACLIDVLIWKRVSAEFVSNCEWPWLWRPGS